MRDRPETVAFWRGRLPHWDVAEGRYSITVHLAGAIPSGGRERIRALGAQLERAVANGQDSLDLQRRISGEMEHWLDRAPTVAHLTVPAVAQMTCDAIDHRIKSGIWKVYEYVLMPSHVHLFLRVLQGTLRSAMYSFKEWTGRRGKELAGIGGRRFWQVEWFDHWSRSAEQDERIQRYIRRNPVKAGLAERYQDWPWGSWRNQ